MSYQVVYPLTVPTKRLAANLGAADMTFRLSNIEGWNGSDLTASDFADQAYGCFRDANGTVLELFEFDPTTIANGSITILRRGLKFNGDRTTEVSANKLEWVQGTTLVELGTSMPQFFQWLKEYIDAASIAGAVPAGVATLGIVKISVAASNAAQPIAVGDNDPRVFPNAYGVDAGGTDAYAFSLSPGPSSYVAGQVYAFKANTKNSGPATLNVNSLGAKSILRSDASALADGDITAGSIIFVIYDGTQFRMFKGNVSTDYQAFTANGTWTKPDGLSGNEIVVIQVWGGGGGGGGKQSTGNGGGGGGGGGGFIEVRKLASALGATESVTVGVSVAGGTGGANGTAGNSSSFGSHATAYGGAGGAGGDPGTTLVGGGGGGAAGAGSGSTGGGPGGSTAGVGNSGFGGAGGGSGAAGGASYAGGGGGGGNNANNGGASVFGGGGGGAGGNGSAGTGGASTYGGAGGAGNGSGNGSDGTAPGGGGGGGGNATGTARNGGAGARGEVRVWVIRS